MKKHWTIYILGILFFVPALLKHFLIAEELPAAFILLEVLSFLIVILLIYRGLNNKYNNIVLDSGVDKETKLYKEECDRLNIELDKYRKEESDRDKNYGFEELLFTELKNSIENSSDQEEKAKNVLGVIKNNCEWMAAVAYCNNDNDLFAPVDSVGIDEEWQINPVAGGDGFNGQAILDNKAMEISDIPEDYFEVNSALPSTGNHCKHQDLMYLLWHRNFSRLF